MHAIKEMVLHSAELQDKIAIEFIGNVNSEFKSGVEQDEIFAHHPVCRPCAAQRVVRHLRKTDLQLLVLLPAGHCPGNLPGKFLNTWPATPFWPLLC